MRKIEVNQRLWRDAWHATVTGGCALFAGSAAAQWAHVPTAPLLTAGAVCLLLSTLVVLFRTGSGPMAMYALAWAALVFGWVTWSRFGNPWTRWPLTALVLAVFMLGVGGALIVGAWDAQISRMANAELARLDAAERRRYEAAFSQHGCPLSVTGIDTAANGAKVIKLDLGESGRTTKARIEGITDALEVTLNLQPGAIRLEHGEGARFVTMRVGMSDVLTEAVHAPDEWGPLSINRPIRIGLREAGRAMLVVLREICTLVVGQRGSGKSNLANVFIAQLTRCVDCLVFVIDLKQGRMARPWVQPWARGDVPRPAVDWVATTREEAMVMLQAMQRAGDARAYTGIGGEKHIPTAEHPAIMLITDETAVIFNPGAGPKKSQTTPPCGNWEIHRGPHTFIKTAGYGTDAKEVTSSCPGIEVTNAELAAIGEDIVQRFRSEAIDMILFSLRAVVDLVGGGNLKAQTAFRVGLQVQSEAEASYLLEGDQHASKWLAKMRHAGAAVAQLLNGKAAVFKVDRIEYDRIAEIAAQTWQYRPEPDPVMAKAMGPAWSERWIRAQPWIAHLRDAQPAQSAPGGATAAPVTVLPDVDDVFGQLVQTLTDVDEIRPDVDERRVRMRNIVLAHHDPLGISPSWINRLFAEDEKAGKGKAPARPVVQGWLADDVKAGILRKTRYGRYGRPQ